MTPQEKAEELVEKFDELLTYKESKTKVKQCALIAVDEIIELLPEIAFGMKIIGYYQQVKQEIEKL